MLDVLSRAFDMLVVWSVTGALLFWPLAAVRWRTALAVLMSASGVLFLILAMNTEGVRETPTVSVFLVGRAYVTQRTEALASLPYYLMTGVCLLLGTAGLALPERLTVRIREHWLVWSVTLAGLATLLRFALEKLAAPQPWTQAVGITWAAPIVGAYCYHNVRSEGRRFPALVAALLLYGFGSRAVVALLMAVASAFELGSHYDVTPLARVMNPFTQKVYEFEPGSLRQILSLGVLPQLGVWPFYTVLSGLIGVLGYMALARLLPESARRR